MKRSFFSLTVVAMSVFIMGSSGRCNRVVPDHCLYDNMLTKLYIDIPDNSFCPTFNICPPEEDPIWNYPNPNPLTFYPDQKQGYISIVIKDCPLSESWYWHKGSVTNQSEGCSILVYSNKSVVTYAWISFYSECNFCTTNKRAVYQTGLSVIPKNRSSHTLEPQLALESTYPNHVLGQCD